MAQTGDVKFGNTSSPDFNLALAGTGGSVPNLKAEFSDIAHTRGILSAARSADPNSANSQFFICLTRTTFRQTISCFEKSYQRYGVYRQN